MMKTRGTLAVCRRRPVNWLRLAAACGAPLRLRQGQRLPADRLRNATVRVKPPPGHLLRLETRFEAEPGRLRDGDANRHHLSRPHTSRDARGNPRARSESRSSCPIYPEFHDQVPTRKDCTGSSLSKSDARNAAQPRSPEFRLSVRQSKTSAALFHRPGRGGTVGPGLTTLGSAHQLRTRPGDGNPTSPRHPGNSPHAAKRGRRRWPCASFDRVSFASSAGPPDRVPAQRLAVESD